ncbi:MAG: DUF916 domain-containing protein [Parcubacteria group bacterium]|jgi:hypothetical protein
MKITLYNVIIAIFLTISLFPSFVCAEKLGIAVSESKIAFDMDIDENQNFNVKVTNVSDETQKIIVDIMDYDIGDENSIILRNDSDEQNGIKEWINIPEKEFDLPPNAGKDVSFTVHVPENASVGSHRGAVIFRMVPVGDASVKVQGQIGVHVLVNVKGNTHATGTLHWFDVPLFTTHQIIYRAQFENTGNIHYVPHGDIFLRNIVTNKKSAYDFNAEDHFVMPGKKFTFTFMQDIPSVFGVYYARARFVDGEGAIRQKSDIVMGYMFPVEIVSALCVVFFGIRQIKTYKRKRIAH